MTKREAPRYSDVKSNIFTGAPSFSLANRLTRALWLLTWALLASWTPPPLHRWRIALLRLFGARVDWSCKVYRSVRVWYPANLTMHPYAVLGPGVDCYNQAPICIGRYAIVSQRAYLCTGSHAIRDPAFQLITRPVEIGQNAWVAAEAFVGPGVRVGEGAVLAGRGVAFRDLDPWTVYRGNPAEVVKTREKFQRP